MAGVILEVKLCRDGLQSPWGFRLKGGKDYHLPLVVQRVGVPSAAEGNLHPGDIIRRIAMTDASNITQDEATRLISNAGSVLPLTILRGAVVELKNPVTVSRKPASLGDEDEDPKVPHNSKLAQLMTQSLHGRTDQDKTGVNQLSRTMPHFYRMQNKHLMEKDITSYLPKPPTSTKRTTSLNGTQMDNELSYGQGRNVFDQQSPSAESQDSGISVNSNREFRYDQGPSANYANLQGTSHNYAVGPTLYPNYSSLSKGNSYYEYNGPEDDLSRYPVPRSWPKKPQVRFDEDVRYSPAHKLVQQLQNAEEETRNLAGVNASTYAYEHTYHKY